MHIAEGILPPAVLVGGAVVAGAAVVVGLRRIDDENIVKVSVLSSAFFVASLIHIPVGPASVHLLMIGLTGLLLGWMVFPSVAVALLLHVLMFGFGGFTTLGVNILVMGLPALCTYCAFNSAAQRFDGTWIFVVGFAAGSFSVLLGAIMLSAILVTGGEAFTAVALATLLAHIPVMAIEGFVTGWAVSFLRKVRPSAFEGGLLSTLAAES